MAVTGVKVRPAWGWPLIMAFIRLGLALAGNALAILAYQLSGQPVGVAAGLGWSPLILTVVNLLCLGLLVWRGRVEGFDLWEMIGFRWRLLARDILLGLVWSFLLFGLIWIAVVAVMLALYGTEGITNFPALFFGDANFSFTLPAWLVLVSALVFPLTNPLVEELQYRGYAQPRLIAASGSVRIGIFVTAVGFGLQHIVFAVTPTAAIAYSVGFFLWGFGAGLIAHRQGRLVQLIVAHFISNLTFGIFPLFFTA